MEKTCEIRRIITEVTIMKKYIKPCLVTQSKVKGIIPLAALSVAELAGVASVVGLAVGMAASSKGSNDIVAFRSNLVLQK